MSLKNTFLLIIGPLLSLGAQAETAITSICF